MPNSTSQPQSHDAQRAACRHRHRSSTPEQVEQLDHYRRLLWSWNERMNLTRHTTLEKFVGRDVVDSYQLSQLLEQASACSTWAPAAACRASCWRSCGPT